MLEQKSKIAAEIIILFYYYEEHSDIKNTIKQYINRNF